MDNAGLNRTGSSGINGAIIPTVTDTHFYAFSCTSFSLSHSVFLLWFCSSLYVVSFVAVCVCMSFLCERYSSLVPSLSLAFTAFQYTTSFLGLPDTTTVASIQSAGSNFCAIPWTDVIRQYTDPNIAPFLNTYCFNAAYVSALLARGYGFSVTDSELTFAQSVDGVEAGWALGAMTYEAGLLPWESPDLDPPIPVMLLFTPLGVALEVIGGAVVAVAVVLLFVPCGRRSPHELTPLMEQRNL